MVGTRFGVMSGVLKCSFNVALPRFEGKPVCTMHINEKIEAKQLFLKKKCHHFAVFFSKKNGTIHSQ